MFAKLRVSRQSPPIRPPMRERTIKIRSRAQLARVLDTVPKESLDRLTRKQRERFLKARRELNQATTKEKFDAWRKRHDASLKNIGILLGGGAFSVGFPVGLVMGTTLPVAAGVAGGLGAAVLIKDMRSPKARAIIKDQSGFIKRKQREGFTKKEARVIMKADIIRLEKQAVKRGEPTMIERERRQRVLRDIRGVRGFNEKKARQLIKEGKL